MKIEVCCGMKIRISSWLENRFKIVGRCKIDIYGWTGSSVAMLGWQPDPAWQARYLPVMSDNTNLISSTTDNSCVGSIMLLKSSMINIPNSEQSDLSECALYWNLIILNCHSWDSWTFCKYWTWTWSGCDNDKRAGSHQVARVAVTAPSPVSPESADVTFLRDNCQWQSEANIVLCWHVSYPG